MTMKFVIEHLESELFEWCLIEYKHISEIIGKNNLIFTCINKKDLIKLKKYGTACEKSISELKFEKICVLSQYAEKMLASNDKIKFQYFVFGGILGDNPAKKRTNEIINKLERFKISYETRSLGNVQMPTDVAVYAAKKILEGKKLSDFKFVDHIEMEVDEGESIELNFRYIVDNNKLIISEKLVEYLRRREEF